MVSAVLALVLGGAGVGVAGAETGTDLYVDNAAADCSDTGPGSQAEPFCQIQPAADAAVPGTTVHIAQKAGAYHPVTIRSVGTADEPITFTVVGHPPVAVQSSGTPALTFSGAQYVAVTGLPSFASAATALVITDSHHISYDAATVESAGTGTPGPTIAVDGTSSGISLSRLTVPNAPKWGFASEAGARDITLADDLFLGQVGGGVSAAGTTGIELAGDTISSRCGQAVSLTDGTSGSVENTVAYAGTGAGCPSTGAPAEISVDAASAPQVTADYNAVNPLSTGTDYAWAGTAYGTGAAFRAGTGQGAHDLDQTDLTLGGGGSVAEDSPLIDSADADAPGELSTDVLGQSRVDDPLVADTGTGAGDYDRGAREFQDPLAVTGLTMSSKNVYAGIPVAFTAVVSNPWSDPLDLSYSFDFGDGSTATSTTGSVAHTYAQESNDIEATVVGDRADGTQMPPAYTPYFGVYPVTPLTEGVGCGTNPSAPDTATCGFDTDTFVLYPVTSMQTTFGDGTAAVSSMSGNLTHTYASAGTYTVTRKVTDSAGRTATGSTKVTVGTAYVPNGPWRILDTRYGTGAAKRKIGPGGVVRVKILGVDGIPATGVTAVTMNLTDTDATASSVVTAYPDGTSRPTASNLNFLAGQTNPNLVTVRVGKDGYVDLYNAHGYVDLIADAEGYFTTTPSTDNEGMSSLAPVTPVRVLDTRYGIGARTGKVGPGSITTITVPAAKGLTSVGAAVNLTVTGGTKSGVVTVYCGSSYPPIASNVNYRAGQTVSNLVVSNVCSGGQLEIYNSAGYVHLIADLQGVYTNEFAGQSEADTTSPVGGQFVPTTPTRFLDTRYGIGAAAKRLGANSTLAVKVAGVDGVPVGAGAVVVNLTGTGPTTSTHLTAFGDGSLPNASNLNLVAGETRPVLAVIPLDADGYIHLHNAGGSVNVIADLEGYVG
jgi:PKD repeat protein